MAARLRGTVQGLPAKGKFLHVIRAMPPHFTMRLCARHDLAMRIACGFWRMNPNAPACDK